jgi:hypothetical protein
MQLIFNPIFYSNLNANLKVKTCLETKNGPKDLELPQFPQKEGWIADVPNKNSEIVGFPIQTLKYLISLLKLKIISFIPFLYLNYF